MLGGPRLLLGETLDGGKAEEIGQEMSESRIINSAVVVTGCLGALIAFLVLPVSGSNHSSSPEPGSVTHTHQHAKMK